MANSRTMRRAANQTALPRFELNLPPRPLVPMAAVSHDSGSDGSTTTYAVQPQLLSSSPELSSSPSASDRYGPTRVTKYIYLGGQGDAQNLHTLETLGIRRILNVAEECRDDRASAASREIIMKHVEIRDHSDENITSHFEECIGFIRQAVLLQEPVLVHCRFGVSRSATMVIAYLMRFGPHDDGSSSATPVSSPNSTSSPHHCQQLELSSTDHGLSPQLSTTPVTMSTATRMSYDESFEWVKDRRPQVSPNLGFVLALQSFGRPDATQF